MFAQIINKAFYEQCFLANVNSANIRYLLTFC
nr:MAG TPA: hypothetical protein [Caudoviricetes sp.]